MIAAKKEGKAKKKNNKKDPKTDDSIFSAIGNSLFDAEIFTVEGIFGAAEKKREDTSFKFFNVLVKQLITIFGQFKYNHYIGQLFCNRLNQASLLIFNDQDGLVFQLKDQLQVTVPSLVIKPQIKELETVIHNAIKYFNRYTKSDALTHLLVGYEFKNELFKFDGALRSVFSKIWDQYSLQDSKYKLTSSWGLEDVEFFCNLTRLIEISKKNKSDSQTSDDEDDDESLNAEDELDQVSINELFEFNGTSVEEVDEYLTDLKATANKRVSFRAQQIILQRALYEFWIGSFKEAVLVTQDHFTEKCVEYLKDQSIIDDKRASTLCEEFLNLVNVMNTSNGAMSSRTFGASSAEPLSSSGHGLMTTLKALHSLSNEKTVEIVDIARLCRPIESDNLDLAGVMSQIIKLTRNAERVRFYPPLNSVINKSLIEACTHQETVKVDDLKIIWEVKEKGRHSRKAIDEKHLLCDMLLNSRGWALVYGPKMSGKTLKLVAACHEIGQKHLSTERDISYVNMDGSFTNEVDCYSRVTSQLYLNCNSPKNLTKQDAINAFRLFLHRLPVSSVVIFDNFRNEDEHDFGVDEVYFIDNKVALVSQSKKNSNTNSPFMMGLAPSSLDYFFSIFGDVLQEYEYKLCFVLGYSSNSIDKVNTLFRTANQSHKCCISTIDINTNDKYSMNEEESMSSDSYGNLGSPHTTGNVISAYFEIGPLSNSLAENLASILLPADPVTLLTASQNVSGKMIELVSLLYYKDIRNIGKIVLSFFNMKTKRFQDVSPVIDSATNSPDTSGRPIPLLRQKSKTKSKRKSLFTSHPSEGVNAMFPEEIIRGLSVNTLNRLTRNELLCMCCLLSASVKKSYSTVAGNGDDQDDTTLSSFGTIEKPPELDLNTVVDGNALTKTQSIAIPGLGQAIQRSISLKHNQENVDDHTIGSMLHCSYFDAALIWSLCQESFDQNILHWHIALTSLVETGLVHYEPELGYSLPYLYQPVEIALTNQTAKQKLVLQACQVDSKHQLYVYFLHFINEMHRVNCQSYCSVDSGLTYFDKNRYHFRQVIVAFMSTSKSMDGESISLNDKLTFALCGSLCNVVTYRIETPIAVELCLQVLKRMQALLTNGSNLSDNISEQFISIIDLEIQLEKKPKEYLLYLHYIRAWYDVVTQYLRQNDGILKASNLVEKLSEDESTLHQLPTLERVRILQLQGFLCEHKHLDETAVQFFTQGYELMQSKFETFKVKNKPNYITMKCLLDVLYLSLNNSVSSLKEKPVKGCCIVC